MTAANKKPNAFLAAMQDAGPATLTGPATAEPVRRAPAGKPEYRAGLKHVGGYLDRSTVEKVAVLRARLECDNSELLKRAIDDLYRKHEAQRSFGDV